MTKLIKKFPTIVLNNKVGLRTEIIDKFFLFKIKTQHTPYNAKLMPKGIHQYASLPTINFLDLNNMERCNNCFLVFCKKCMSEHKEKEGHTNSIELDKIDTFCYRHNIRNEYFNNDSKYHICKECYNKLTEDKFIISIEDFIKTEEFFPNRNSINQEYKDVEKEIQICEKLINSLNDWKNNLLNKINKIKEIMICQLINFQSMNIFQDQKTKAEAGICLEG